MCSASAQHDTLFPHDKQFPTSIDDNRNRNRYTVIIHSISILASNDKMVPKPICE